MPSYIFDIETDGLLENVSTIHCICAKNLSNGKELQFSLQEVPKGLELLSRADRLVGHNVINYDIPVIKKLYPRWSYHGATVYDTLVAARVAYPDVKDTDYGLWRKGKLPGKLIGSHSLEAWGYRLGILKGEYGKQSGAWERWSPEMVEYCKQDVLVTEALMNRLEEQEVKPCVQELEHQVQWILSRQERWGFLFNKRKAELLHAALLKHQARLLQRLQKMVPPFYVPATKLTDYIVNKDRTPDPGGGAVFTPKANNSRMNYTAGAPMTKVELTEFQPSSHPQLVWHLRKTYGWVSTEKTDSGLPKIDDDVLKTLPYPEAPVLAEYLTVTKRIAQLADGSQAWLKYVREDGRIHGSVNTCGAVTRRMTHFNPNMAQVPAAYSRWGKACRSLFQAPEGRVIVGIDASGLEARCLAHYLAPYDGGTYAKAVVSGTKEDGTDVHTINMKALGITSRDIAKTWFYAWMYGAGKEKLAKILGCSSDEAGEAGWRFLQNLPAFADLKIDVDKAVKTRKFLKAIDGGILRVRSPHSALNTLLQSAGAIVMKKALVLLDQTLTSIGLANSTHTTVPDYEFLANVHDEWQIETTPELADCIGGYGTLSIERSGAFLNMKCPLAGEYKVGRTWKETH